MSSRQMEEMEENAFKKRLAQKLGISIDDLSELEWEIVDNLSEDGEIYSQIIQFSEDSPREILDKITDLSDSNNIELDVNF